MGNASYSSSVDNLMDNVQEVVKRPVEITVEGTVYDDNGRKAAATGNLWNIVDLDISM